jgi:hypothetical protein
MTKVMFEENKLYSARPTPETDAAWDALLPVSFFSLHKTMEVALLVWAASSQGKNNDLERL